MGNTQNFLPFCFVYIKIGVAFKNMTEGKATC